MNHEDAIVVSEAIVDRFASTHVLSIREQLSAGSEIGITFIRPYTEVMAGDQLAIVQSVVHPDHDPRRTVEAPEAGVVESIDIDEEVVTVQLRTPWPSATSSRTATAERGSSRRSYPSPRCRHCPTAAGWRCCSTHWE